MPLTFRSKTDSVVFVDDDMPDQIPLGEQLTGDPQVLSDGSHILPRTGETPSDILLQGTLRYNDGNQGLTRLQKMQKLQRMKSRMEPVTVSPWIGDVVIRDVEYSIVRNGEITYMITLFREVSGFLASQKITNQSFSAKTTAFDAQKQIVTLQPSLSAKSSLQALQYSQDLQNYLDAKGQ